MNKVEFLDTLFGARDEISRLIIRMTPKNSDEEDDMSHLLQQRDQISTLIRRVIAAKMADGADGLQDATKKVEASTRDLKALKETAEGVKTALGIVAGIAKVVSALLGALPK